MINYLVGKVLQVKEKTITLTINGLGLSIQIPQTQHIEVGKEIKLHTYLHWNQEKGPSLFGFQEEIEKITFLMLIGCSKIGPSIAMNILSQLTANQILQAVNTQDEKALSKVNGIGIKKAEQIIVQLKHKVSKLLVSGQIQTATQQDFTMWQNVNDVLISLNYSKTEITRAMQHLTEKYSGQNVQLDKLIRSALSFLSGNI
jgi:Holliday junction DNA helicase RuvA